MPSVTPEYLRFLSRWDRDADALRAAFSERAGVPVRFTERPPPSDPSALFRLFERDPLDAVTELPDGSRQLSYNPFRSWRAIVEEQYLGEPKPPLHARLPIPVHKVPGALRLKLYPLVAGRPEAGPEDCPPDPAWPIEPRLDRFRADLFAGLPHVPPAPGAGAWPGGARFPLLVTHDVDTKAGMVRAGVVLDEMERLGLRPCFFLVGHGYTWDKGFIEAVRQAGGEIGLHGDLHDNRIAFLPAAKAAERLDTCRELIEEHGIRGFRSPSLLVSPALYEAVQPRFAWDSSVPDTDTHTLLGVRRGCGTVFPFRRNGCLVLPTTMPADDRLLLLGYRGLDLTDVLRRKFAHVRALGGLCHFLTHPEPHLFGRRMLRDLFRAVFTEILDTDEAWVATPSMVAEYWESLTASGAGNGTAP